MIKHSNMNLMGFFIRIKINGFRGKFADLWPGALGWKILGAQLRHHVLPSFSGTKPPNHHQTPKPLADQNITQKKQTKACITMKQLKLTP